MKIITDCAADLTPAEAAELDIAVAPLFIQFPGEEVNAWDLTPDAFYDRLQGMWPQIPTTAQPSAGLFADLYAKLGASGEPLLSIHISSGLSGTIQSARLGAENAPNVTLVDSMTLAGGQRFQVLAAARAARAGWALPDILARLTAIRDAAEVVYTLETLTYLAKGGRIGRVSALAGSLLHIKPVIHVDHADGKYSNVGKGRSLPRAMEIIVDHLRTKYGAEEPLWLTLQHGQRPALAETMAEMLRAALHVGHMETIRVSPVLGVHTGPGIIGVGALPMSLVADLP